MVDLKKELYAVNIKLAIFDTSFDLFIGNIEFADKYLKVNHREIPDNSYIDGYVTENGDMVLPNRKNISVIAHEAVHLAMHVAESRNIVFARRTGKHEVLAYLVGYVVESVLSQKLFYKYNERTDKFGKKAYLLPRPSIK